MKHPHRRVLVPGPFSYDLAMVSKELLAARREESRRRADRGKMEQWLDSLTARTASGVAAAQGQEVVIPNFSRNITIRFENTEVNRKLVRLVNTDVVKIMDKGYMYNLQNRLYESYSEDFQKRLDARRNWESDRRRRLALEGIQPMDDDSLKHHPVTQVMDRVKNELEIYKERKKEPYHTRKKMLCDWNQFAIEPKIEEESSESTGDDLTNEEEEFHEEELGRQKLEGEVQGPNMAKLMSDEFYEKIKYEPPLVKNLRAAHTVKEMYDIAEQILQYRIYEPLTEAMIKTGLEVDSGANQPPDIASSPQAAGPTD